MAASSAPVNGVGPATVGFADDRLECETMPLESFVYAGRRFADVFTPTQQAALRGPFPRGVCDYSKPGKGFQPAVTWLTYQDAAGKVVYGGVPMGASPVSTAVAAASAFGRAPGHWRRPAPGRRGGAAPPPRRTAQPAVTHRGLTKPEVSAR